MDNPVNTTMFSPLISSPYSAFETFQSSKFLRTMIRSPIPSFPRMPQPIFTDAGPSLPSFPQNFASFSSFCTNAPMDEQAAYQGTQNISLNDLRPPKRSRIEKDVSKSRKDLAKMCEALSIQNTMMTYMMNEHQIFRTWLVEEFYPAMRVNPPLTNPAPPTQEFPNFDFTTSFDDSSPTVPQ
ncbi:hypothetical protein QL285_038703 [Trifolium repens]|nr:hypothetical protein QL285_038703 [Trifolium repens]